MIRSQRTWTAAIVLTAVLSVSAFSPDRLRTTVEWLSDAMREGRAATSDGAAATGDYLLEQFRAAGLDAEFQAIDGRRRNVVGRLGTASRHIVVGAHYDGQGRGFPSASDNAAGVALMLELARELSRTDLPVSVLFIAFDDEERGLAGSRHYVQEPVLPLEDAIAAVILDTMGRSFLDLDRWTLIVLGSEFSPELGSIVDRTAESELMFLGTDLIGPRSDFAPFAMHGVPYLFFSNATHADYHGRGDTADRILYDRLAVDGDTIREVVTNIANLTMNPEYLGTPRYPDGEVAGLLSMLSTIEDERSGLSEEYRLLLDDLKTRLSAAPSRRDLRLATSVLLAMATPRVSSFSLVSLIGPFYESAGQGDVARAAYREALRWTTNATLRRSVEAKIQALD